MEPLTLTVDHLYLSPYAMSAFVALEEKGLPYALREVSLPRGDQRAPAFPAFTGRVPVLEHGAYALSESVAIAEYVAETFPYPGASPARIFPPDLRDRGRCREVMMWLRSDLLPIRTERPTHTVFYEPSQAPLSAEAEAEIARLLRACDRLISEDRATLFADWCIADADLTMMLMRLVRSEVPMADRVRRYVDENWQRPSLRKWWDRTRPPFEAY